MLGQQVVEKNVVVTPGRHSLLQVMQALWDQDYSGRVLAPSGHRVEVEDAFAALQVDDGQWSSECRSALDFEGGQGGSWQWDGVQGSRAHKSLKKLWRRSALDFEGSPVSSLDGVQDAEAHGSDGGVQCASLQSNKNEVQGSLHGVQSFQEDISDDCFLKGVQDVGPGAQEHGSDDACAQVLSSDDGVQVSWKAVETTQPVSQVHGCGVQCALNGIPNSFLNSHKELAQCSFV